MKKNKFWRVFFYIAGLFILAFGITLNTKSGLGVTPILSVAYSTSIILNVNFGNTTLVLYILFVLAEILLHIWQSKHGQLKTALTVQLGKDVLQFPLSLVFTRFLNLFSAWIPTPETLFLRFLVLIFGIIGTGIGAAMSLNMRIVPNPGDGIVQVIADCVHKSVGLTKNCVDLCSICITIGIGLIFAHKLVGVGAGTIIAVLGVGRVIALFNYCFMKKMNRLAGL